MISEAKFQKKVIASFKQRGAMVLNIHGHAMQAPGWPDLCIVMHQWNGWLELKREDGKLSTIQKLIIEELSRRGQNAFVLRSIFDDCYILETSVGLMLGKGLIVNLPQDLINLTQK